VISPEWDVSRSVAAIRASAAKGKCITYGELAQANGLVWSAKVRSECVRHLAQVCARAREDADAMISSIVVNAESRETRMLTEFALSGFLRCATDLNFEVGTDGKAFLARQQEATFAWAGRTRA